MLRKFRTAYLVFTLLIMAGCAGGFITSIGSKDEAAFNLGAAVLVECPKKQLDSDEFLFIDPVTSTLISPAIETGLNLIHTALEDASKANTKTVSTQTSSNFFRIHIDEQEGIINSANIIINPANRCLVVAYGPTFQETWPARRKFYDENLRQSLADHFKIQGKPTFYYEGYFDYSEDGTAFRIVSATLDYSKTIANGETGVRDLSLEFSFSLPNAPQQHK